jgi:small subunit ribosomal protein S4
MSRYTGPAFKKSRRYGFSTLETGKEFAKGKQREFAPGQHGQRRQKLSDYGLHLYEKQKVKYMYGLTEKQFKNTFKKSSKLKGVAGVNFLQLLESRMDNVVYRMGFAETRRQSRQLVNHGHFLVNGKKVSIPSYNVNINDEIALKPKSQSNKQIIAALESKTAAS